MMESLVSSRLSGEGVRRRIGLQSCPHCGGNVRLIRDTYGAYHQCIQCSRELEEAEMVAQIRQPTVGIDAEPRTDELMIA